MPMKWLITKIKLKIKNIKRGGNTEKKNEKSELEKNIQYFEYIEEKNNNKFYWKYSLSKYHIKTNPGYYYCSDTSCNGKGYNIFKFDEKKNLFENLK